MILGIAEDFTSNVVLDSSLTSIPENGLFLNSGVHPSITIDNLLSFLPVLDKQISIWDSEKEYGIYSESRNINDIVNVDGIIYESLASNDGVNPTSSPSIWLKTNIESLRIKRFIAAVSDKCLSDLNLTKRIINNQFLYEIGRHKRMLPTNYCGWVFQPKGSDYVTIRINEISLQADGETPVTMYVVNKRQVVTTLTLTPSNGEISFQPVTYSFKGQGEWRFVIASQNVYSNNGWIDALKYDGFVCYSCVGLGTDPATAKYSIGDTSNGLGFNVTAYLDPGDYVTNNINEFGNFVRATFEYMCFVMFAANSNNRLNAQERIQLSGVNLIAETKQLDPNVDNAINRYREEKTLAIASLEKTFDTQLKKKSAYQVKVGSV